MNPIGWAQNNLQNKTNFSLHPYSTAMILVLCAALLLAVTRGMGNNHIGHPFQLLPKQSSWPTIAADSDSNQISTIVHAYIKPFALYQIASRDFSIPAQKLKENVIAALDLLAEASKTFNIPKSGYENSKKDIESALKVPLTIFTLKRAKAVEPTFTPKALAAFTKVRLSHLITHKDGYMHFLVAKYQYESTLKEWLITATRLPKCKFRALMARNLDMAYIEHTLAVYLDAMRLRDKAREGESIPLHKRILMKLHKDTLIKNMESFGNGYAVSKPPHSAFLILATSLYALLITLMI